MYEFALKHTAIERFVTLSHGAGEKEHKMKCCSCSCKINLDGRWTRMSVFDIPACTGVGAAPPELRARA